VGNAMQNSAAFILIVSYAIYLAEREVLAVGNYLLIKEEQDEALKENYEERYELD